MCYLISHFTRYLTNEGIEYLRQYLHLPAEIVPSTLKKSTRAPAQRAVEGDRPPRMGRGGGGYGGGRDEYRKAQPAPGEFNPTFVCQKILTHLLNIFFCRVVDGVLAEVLLLQNETVLFGGNWILFHLLLCHATVWLRKNGFTRIATFDLQSHSAFSIYLCTDFLVYNQ